MCEKGSYSPCLPSFLSPPQTLPTTPVLTSAGRSLGIAATEGKARVLCIQGLCLGAGHGLFRAGGWSPREPAG